VVLADHQVAGAEFAEQRVRRLDVHVRGVRQVVCGRARIRREVGDDVPGGVVVALRLAPRGVHADDDRRRLQEVDDGLRCRLVLTGAVLEL